jgi:hypothetical protein
MHGAQKLRSEAHLRVRRNDEVETQRRSWTFYTAIDTFSLNYTTRCAKKIQTGRGEKRKWIGQRESS